MENKDIVIIALIVVIIYLYYQQNNQANLNTQPNIQKIQELKTQVNHYQTLYENRVKKDLGYSQSSQQTQTNLTVDDKETQTEDDQLKIQHQEQLRKINLLFDEKAQDYSFIDFNGLYALLSSIAEREREREQTSRN